MLLHSVSEERQDSHLVSFQEDLQGRGEWEAATPLHHESPVHFHGLLSDWLAGREKLLKERMWLLSSRP